MQATLLALLVAPVGAVTIGPEAQTHPVERGLLVRVTLAAPVMTPILVQAAVVLALLAVMVVALLPVLAETAY
jgi:hypothetical protein